MDQIRIEGGSPLNGVIPISGAKNAALPLMIASLLTSDTLTLKNVPNLADTNLLARILRNHGVDCAVDGKRANNGGHAGETFHLTARDIVDTRAPYDMVRRMRASFWVLGPLLARHGEATVSLPGGCAIGTRPVDLHLTGLQKLGAEMELSGGYVLAKAPKGLRGGHIKFPKVSVGATHNVLMAAVLAKGETLIENAALEPEIGDLATCLTKMGAQIEGIDTPTLRIQGVDFLEGAVHSVLPDRIETGTYAMAVAATGGSVLLEGARADLLQEALNVLRAAGVDITETNRGIQVSCNGAGSVAGQSRNQAVPRFSDRPASPAHGADGDQFRRVEHPRDNLREPFHACVGADAARRRYRHSRRYGAYSRRPGASRSRSDGDRPSRLGIAGHRRAHGARRNDHQSGLSS